MALAHTIDHETENTNRVSFGFWVYLMSDCLLFASLFATYAVLNGAVYGGPAGRDIFDLQFVLTETLILLTSSFTVGLAMLSAYRKHMYAALWTLGITLILGATFLGMEITEFRHLISEGAGPDRSAFLSSFFTLVGTHGAHVFVGALWMLLITIRIAYQGITASNIRKLICVSLFWHFLDVVWIFIFTYVYLFGIVL